MLSQQHPSIMPLPICAQIILWFIALCYGCTTYFLAAKVYIEAYHTVPKVRTVCNRADTWRSQNYVHTRHDVRPA
jgi:hypothetical protein